MRRRTRFLTVTIAAGALAGSALVAGAPAQTPSPTATPTPTPTPVAPKALRMWEVRTGKHHWAGNLHLMLPQGMSGDDCAFGPVRVRAKLHGKVQDHTTPKLDDHCRATFKVHLRGPVDPHAVVLHAKFLGNASLSPIRAHKDRL
jgi:hypothetical protein